MSPLAKGRKSSSFQKIPLWHSFDLGTDLSTVVFGSMIYLELGKIPGPPGQQAGSLSAGRDGRVGAGWPVRVGQAIVPV